MSTLRDSLSVRPFPINTAPSVVMRLFLENISAHVMHTHTHAHTHTHTHTHTHEDTKLVVCTISVDLSAGCQIERVLFFTGIMLYLSENTNTGTARANDGDNHVYANTVADVQV